MESCHHHHHIHHLPSSSSPGHHLPPSPPSLPHINVTPSFHHPSSSLPLMVVNGGYTMAIVCLIGWLHILSLLYYYYYCLHIHYTTYYILIYYMLLFTGVNIITLLSSLRLGLTSGRPHTNMVHIVYIYAHWDTGQSEYTHTSPPEVTPHSNDHLPPGPRWNGSPSLNIYCWGWASWAGRGW